MLTRALLAVLALPGLVAVLVPLLIARVALRDASFRWIALVPLLAGAGFLLWCVRELAVAGKGTLAPWDPPRHLVASGVYGLSRNPMYLAVGLMLIGWAIGFASWTLLGYALLVILAFHLRVVLGEEPRLARTHPERWTRYAARVPRWAFRSRGAVLVSWAALLVALPITGLIYEAFADARGASEFPPPGQLVDIGGRRLHLICIGDGAPTVFFEASGWGTALSAAAARERLAARTTVCSYDRSGNGWSDPGPGVVSAADLANDLGVLQDRAKLGAPFVLVASSLGGLTAEMFARQYPERMAGLVLVDAASSLALPRLEAASGRATAVVCGARILAHLGVLRLADPFGLGDASDEARQAAALTYTPRPWAQLCAIARGHERTAREFEEAPALPASLPLTVLSASTADGLVPPGLDRLVDANAVRAALLETHQALAKRSARGTWRMVPDSTHLIGESQPDAVADAVLEMLDGLR
jgi:protein-S-isoprenylcysteine O-methyltransferase Ste14/pimeloyl-ACP methyl ester carboxylesterase